MWKKSYGGEKSLLPSRIIFLCSISLVVLSMLMVRSSAGGMSDVAQIWACFRSLSLIIISFGNLMAFTAQFLCSLLNSSISIAIMFPLLHFVKDNDFSKQPCAVPFVMQTCALANFVFRAFFLAVLRKKC